MFFPFPLLPSSAVCARITRQNTPLPFQAVMAFEKMSTYYHGSTLISAPSLHFQSPLARVFEPHLTLKSELVASLGDQMDYGRTCATQIGRQRIILVHVGIGASRGWDGCRQRSEVRVGIDFCCMHTRYRTRMGGSGGRHIRLFGQAIQLDEVLLTPDF